MHTKLRRPGRGQSGRDARAPLESGFASLGSLSELMRRSGWPKERYEAAKRFHKQRGFQLDGKISDIKLGAGLGWRETAGAGPGTGYDEREQFCQLFE